ncbi:O-antigen ligase family protein [Fictibacillus nanhaiensis]
MYRSYSFGVLFTCLFVSILHNLVSIEIIENRFGWFEYQGEVISDPNYFAVFIGLSLFYFCFTHKIRSIAQNIVILLLLSYFFLNTLSRGVVLAFLITSLLTYLLKEKNKPRILFYSLAGMLCVPIIYLIYSKFGSENATGLNYQSFNRFFLRDSSDRLDVWSAIYNGFSNSDRFTLFFGNGFQSGSSIGAKYYLGLEPTLTQLTFKNPHNMFLQFLVELGIVGTLILSLIFFFFFIRTFLQIQKGNYVPLSLLIFFVIVNTSLNVMGFRELFFIYGILLLSSIRLTKGLDRTEREVVL